MAMDFPNAPVAAEEWTDPGSGKAYTYDGTAWKIAATVAADPGAEYGDVKTSLKDFDHNGWVMLDGRAITALTPSQQAQAINLGFATNLPNATDAVLRQVAGGTLGTVTGSWIIAETQIPAHMHPSRAHGGGAEINFGDPSIPQQPNHCANWWNRDAEIFNSGSLYQVNVFLHGPTGGGQPFTPKSLVTNFFVYLGP